MGRNALAGARPDIIGFCQTKQIFSSVIVLFTFTYYRNNYKYERLLKIQTNAYYEILTNTVTFLVVFFTVFSSLLPVLISYCPAEWQAVKLSLTDSYRETNVGVVVSYE